MCWLPRWGALPSLLLLRAGQRLRIFAPELGGKVERSAWSQSKRGHPAPGSRVPGRWQAGRCGLCCRGWLWPLSGGSAEISIPPAAVCFKKAKPSNNGWVCIARFLGGRRPDAEKLALEFWPGLVGRVAQGTAEGWSGFERFGAGSSWAGRATAWLVAAPGGRYPADVATARTLGCPEGSVPLTACAKKATGVSSCRTCLGHPRVARGGHGWRVAPVGTQPGTGRQQAELAGRLLLEQISGGKCPLQVFCRNFSLGWAGGGFLSRMGATAW